jgi:hypothetical protein
VYRSEIYRYSLIILTEIDHFCFVYRSEIYRYSLIVLTEIDHFRFMYHFEEKKRNYRELSK